MFRALRLVNLRHLRVRPLRAVIAVLSVAAGVSLAVSVVVVRTSATKSFESFARSFAGPAPLRVVGPASRGGLAESVVERVEAVPGVRAAIPMIQAITLADTTDGRELSVIALGYDCRVESLIGRVGCSPDLLRTVTVDAAPIMSSSLAEDLGPRGVIRTNVGPKRVRGALRTDALGDVGQGRTVAYPLHVAQELFTRPGGLDTVYVLPDRGTDIEALRGRLEDAIGAHNTVLTRSDPPGGSELFLQMILLFGLISLFALGTGAVLVHNTVALSLSHRRRDLAMASAVGATQRFIFTSTLAEAATLGALGGTVGTLAGIGIAYPLTANLRDAFTLRMAGLALSVQLGWSAIVAGIGLGMGVALVSALPVARRASRLDVVAELSGRAREVAGASLPNLRRGFVYTAVGGAFVGLTYLSGRGGGLEPWQPIVAQVALLGIMVSLALAAGRFAPRIFQAGARLATKASAPVKLAWSNLVGEGMRSVGMVIATGAAVALAFMISSIAAMITESIVKAEAAQNGGRVLVSTLPLSNTIRVDAKPSPAIVRSISRLPGVESVGRGIAFIATGPQGFYGITSQDEPILAFPLIAGTADHRRFEDGEILIGPGIARREHVGPGDMLRLPGREGFADVKVQGIWKNGNFTGFEATLPMWLIERLWGPQPAHTLAVRTMPGVSHAQLARAIEAAGLDPHLEARTPAKLARDSRGEAAIFLAPFWALQRALLVVAFAAVLFNLLLVAVQRRREMGLISAVGMSPGDLAKMIITEAIGVGVVGACLGTILAFGIIEGFRNTMFLFLPNDMPFRIDPSAPFVYGAITTFVLVIAAALPAWRAARLQVVDAIRYE